MEEVGPWGEGFSLPVSGCSKPPIPSRCPPPCPVTMVTAALNTLLQPLHVPESAGGSILGRICFPEITSHKMLVLEQNGAPKCTELTAPKTSTS